MATFSNVTMVEPFGDWWCVRRRFRYAGQRVTVDVPTDCLTDFASIPEFFQRILHPADARWAMAAIVHDYLYESHRCSRNDADFTLWEAMGVDPQPTRVHPAKAWMRTVFYYGVRLFGRGSYRTGPRRSVERKALYKSGLTL